MITFDENKPQTNSLLAKDLIEGTLCLETTQPVAPQRFGFSIVDKCVGLYSAVSLSPGVVALTRAWNVLDSTWDVFNQLWIPVAQTKQFGLLQSGKPLFLVQLELESDQVTDKVAFSFGTSHLIDLPRGGIQYERAILTGVHILG